MFFITTTLILQEKHPCLPFSWAESQELYCDMATFLGIDKIHVGSSSQPSHELDIAHGQIEILQVALLHSKEPITTIRVTLAEKQQRGERLLTVLNRFQTSSSILLCQRQYDILSLDLGDGNNSGLSTWIDLHATPTKNSIHFTFCTPLVTTPAKRDQALNALPFPEPIVIFSRLEEQWSQLGGPALPARAISLIAATNCVMSNYRLHTVEIPRPSGPLIGYLGDIEYECLEEERSSLAALNALAQLACFTGNGYETVSGMGVTQVNPPHQGKRQEQGEAYGA